MARNAIFNTNHALFSIPFHSMGINCSGITHKKPHIWWHVNSVVCVCVCSNNLWFNLRVVHVRQQFIVLQIFFICLN